LGVLALLVLELPFRVSTDDTSWFHDEMIYEFETMQGHQQAQREFKTFQQGFLK